MPELVPEAFSDSDPSNDTDDEAAFTYPPGMTELTCRLCLPCGWTFPYMGFYLHMCSSTLTHLVHTKVLAILTFPSL